jgi:hypothetical protein
MFLPPFLIDDLLFVAHFIAEPTHLYTRYVCRRPQAPSIDDGDIFLDASVTTTAPIPISETMSTNFFSSPKRGSLFDDNTGFFKTSELISSSTHDDVELDVDADSELLDKLGSELGLN